MSPKKKRLVRAPKTRKPRKKQSWRNASGDWDDLSYDRLERVASPAERERRRQVVQESERAWLGTPQEEYRSDDEATGLLGVVTSVHGSLYLVELSGEPVECHIRESLKDQETGFVNPVAVGDRVVVSEDGAGGFAIEELLERDSFLTRPASFKGYLRQIVAANVDQLLIVSSWREPEFWSELVDRYLVTADVHELDPVICVTKADLIVDTEEFETALAPYQDLDYPIVVTSTTTGLRHGRASRASRWEEHRVVRPVRDGQVVAAQCPETRSCVAYRRDQHVARTGPGAAHNFKGNTLAHR